MDERDRTIRNTTYAQFVELGRAPSAAEAAERAGVSVEQLCAAWQRLHDEHALVLDGDREALRMANPFSAVPTAYRVRAAGRWWYANCAWDAFGICATLDAYGRIETSCADCGDALELEVIDGHPSDTTLLFHCLVPAAQWWDDIGYT